MSGSPFNGDAKMVSCIFIYSIGAWNTGTVPPPEIGKNCCRNLVLFSKALYLATPFPEIIEKLFFLLRFLPKFSKFSQNFPTICVFRPNAQKRNAEFVNLFEKSAKIIHLYQFSDESFSKFSKIFSKFPINYVFRPNAQKGNAWFVKFCEKYAHRCIFSNFLKKAFEKFRNFFLKNFRQIVFRPKAQKFNA